MPAAEPRPLWPRLLKLWPLLAAAVTFVGWFVAREYVPQLADAQVRTECMEEIGKAKQSCTDAVSTVKRELGAEIKASEAANTTAHTALQAEITKAKVAAGRTDERLEAVQRSLGEMRTQQREDQRETQRALQELLRRRGR